MAHPHYQVVLKDQSGTRQAIIVDWQRLSYSLVVNGVDSYALILSGDSPHIAAFELDGQLEVWRRDIAESVDWYKDFEGFHRTHVEQVDGRGQTAFTSYGKGYDDLLSRRIIAYPSGSAFAIKSGPGETVIKEIVNENAGPSATMPPRIYFGVMSGLSIQATAGGGANWQGTLPFKNLLEAVQDIALVTGVNFKTVGIGPSLFEFRARRTDQLVTDRSTQGLNTTTGLNAAGNVPVIFALGFGNMGVPVYSLNRSEEVTTVYVLGQGQEADREIVVRTNLAAIADSPWNRSEVARNANQESATAGLEIIGDQALEEFGERETFSFQPLQTHATLYGRDYFNGDIITARYKGVERHYQIMSVNITVSAGSAEVLNVEVRNVV